jgi:proteasome lid subunit RPN8/RPN11
MTSALHLPGHVVSQLYDYGIACLPAEMSGILIGDGSRITAFMPLTNIALEHDRFQIDTSEQVDAFRTMRKKGLSMMGIVHSHVNVDPIPSARDIAEAAYDTTYVIVGLSNRSAPVLRAFRIFLATGLYEEQEVSIEAD